MISKIFNQIHKNHDENPWKAITVGNKHIIKSKASESDWKLAKLHTQVLIALYLPALGHNWVHFVLPSAMSVIVRGKSAFLMMI